MIKTSIKGLIKQIIKFGITGVLCFIIDYGVLLILTEIFSVFYLISAGISFVMANGVNYFLSIKFVFQSPKVNRGNRLIVFMCLSAIGLMINQLIMWVMVSQMDIHYAISKIAATAIVMIYNFISRKIIIER